MRAMLRFLLLVLPALFLFSAVSAATSECRHAASGKNPGQQIAGSHHHHRHLLRVAHGGPVGKEYSNTAAASQRDQDIVPEALTQSGSIVLSSARCCGAKASKDVKRPAGATSMPVRRTDGGFTVAQPGSAPLAEVARSNRAGGSSSAAVRVVVTTTSGARSHVDCGRFANACTLYGWQARLQSDVTEQRGRAAVARLAHNQEVAGSNPALASTPKQQRALAAGRSSDQHTSTAVARTSVVDVAGEFPIALSGSVRQRAPTSGGLVESPQMQRHCGPSASFARAIA